MAHAALNCVAGPPRKGIVTRGMYTREDSLLNQHLMVRAAHRHFASAVPSAMRLFRAHLLIYARLNNPTDHERSARHHEQALANVAPDTLVHSRSIQVRTF